MVILWELNPFVLLRPWVLVLISNMLSVKINVLLVMLRLTIQVLTVLLVLTVIILIRAIPQMSFVLNVLKVPFSVNGMMSLRKMLLIRIPKLLPVASTLMI